jgi:hypothetical protein
MQPSNVTKYIRKNKFYFGRRFLVYKSDAVLEEILKSEVNLAATNEETKLKKYIHTEKAKESIRKANLGKKLSPKMGLKLSLNSTSAKCIIVVNNKTKETLEFNSVTEAVKSLGIDDPYFRKCLKNNKPCKGYTITAKPED